jgi:Fe-S cluster assembly iron-binding protein IscA
MLQCTQAAAHTISQLRQQQGLPETYGLRVSPTSASSGGVSLGLSFVESPLQDDLVNEEHGQRLYVAPEIADDLADLALDVVTDTTNGAAPAKLTLVPATEAN